MVIEPAATAAEIKERFRFLCHAYHPDKFGTLAQRQAAEREFKRINEAYQVLSEPIQRANYDAQRRPRTQSAAAPRAQSAPPRSQSDSAATVSKVSENKILLLLLWLIAAAMLVFAAVSKHPYSFYTLLRWVCCPIFAFSAFAAYEKKHVLGTWIFGAMTVLYNPLFRVHLDRASWTVTNWFTVGILVGSASILWQTSAKRERSKRPINRENIADILGSSWRLDCCYLDSICLLSSNRKKHTNCRAVAVG